MVNDEFYRVGGPVFLSLESEVAVSPERKPTHTMLMAEKFGALPLLLEHRFYGQSQPTADLVTANLKYLTTQQKLTDVVTLVNEIKEQRKLPLGTKWIIFGTSYGGSLAA